MTISSQTYTTEVEYNARGELISYDYPDGAVVELRCVRVSAVPGSPDPAPYERTYTDRGELYQIKHNSTTQSRTHTAAHKMSGIATTGHSSSSVQHDVKGNVTLIESHYGMKSSDLALYWDFDNRMNSADADEDGFKDVIQMFDALGRRVSRFDDVSNATTIFVQFGQQTICDYASGASPSSSKYRYLYASYIDEPVMRWETAQSDAVYYHRNQQYSIIALTDDTGAIVERYSYTAYGEPAFFDGSGSLLSPQSSSLSNRYTYTGREYDPIIRLYHYRARMYDSQLGRFLGRDPIGYWDGPSLYFAYFVPASIDPIGLARKTYEVLEMNPSPGNTYQTVIAEIDVATNIDASGCIPAAGPGWCICLGDVVVDVSFTWRGLTNDSANTADGGIICNGRDCIDLTTTQQPPGKTGSRQISIPCRGGAANGIIHTLRYTDYDWQQFQDMIDDYVQRGYTWEDAFREIRSRTALFLIHYDVEIDECGRVVRDQVSLSVARAGYGYWNDPNRPPNYPRIREK